MFLKKSRHLSANGDDLLRALEQAVSVAMLNSDSFFNDDSAQFCSGLFMTLLRRSAKPDSRMPEIFSYSFPIAISHAQSILRLIISLARRFSKPFNALHWILLCAQAIKIRNP